MVELTEELRPPLLSRLVTRYPLPGAPYTNCKRVSHLQPLSLRDLLSALASRPARAT